MTVVFLIVIAFLAGSLRTGPELPPTDATADYQLGGVYAPAPGVAVVTRDRTEKPAPGLYNICYVNAFQTQPGQLRWWQSHHPELLLTTAKGDLVRDPDWPDEVLFDIRTDENRSRLSAIVGRWFESCAVDGYQAVEPDNLDSWTRSGGLLKRSHATDTARRMVGEAHGHNLAIGQKNAAELDGSAIGFDFAVAEECEVYRECDAFVAGYGRHVIEIEYSDNGLSAFKRACADHGKDITVLLRDRELVTDEHPDYVYEAC